MKGAPYIWLLYSIATWLFCNQLLSQPQYKFRQAGVDQGLSQSTVLGITQDKIGRMWLATRNGLNRYDGYTFTGYYRDTNTHRLPSGFVKEVFTDSKGDIWTGTSNGLRIYHPANNTFYTPDEHTGFTTGIPDDVEVWKVYEYPTGCIWLLTLQHGLFICNRNTGTMQHFDRQNSTLQHTWVRSMAVNAKGQLYICTPHDVYAVNRSGANNFQILPPYISNLRQDPSDIGIQDLLFETNERLWIACHNTGIAVWDLQHHNWQQPVNHYPMRVLYRDRDSTIWAGSFGAGLLRYARHQPPEQFTHQAFSPGSIGSNFIRSLYRDRQGILWIGTEDEGVSLYDPDRNKIISYDYKDWHLEQLRNIRAIYADNNEVYIGSNITALAVFNLQRRQLTTVPSPVQPEQHHYDIITQLLPIAGNRLLVGTNGSGLFSLDKKTLRLKKITSTAAIRNITRLVARPDNTIWLCTNNGFYRYQPDTEQVTDSCTAHAALRDFSHTYIKTVFEKGDTLWIATDHQGLFAYDLKQQQLLPLTREKEVTSLPFAVNAFLPAGNDLWIATYESGLVRLVVQGNSMMAIPQPGNSNHLPALQLLQDNDDHLWLSTNKGLMRISLSNKQIRYFNQNTGTQGQEYYINSGYKDQQGRLWFGGKNGFDCILPGRLPDAVAPLPVHITRLLIKEQELATDTAIAFKKHIVLHHDQNFLILGFVSPDFAQSEDHQYIYRLKGVDEQWVRSGNIKQARYTDLSGGDYLFEVSVLGTDGKPSGIPARLHITILQPFWHTWWFYTACTLLAVCLAYGLWRYRLYQVEAVYSMRNTISRDLHDDIGGTLSSIHILTEVARQKALQQQGEQAAQILEKVNTLALEMVSRMSDTIWAINPANDNPDKLLERLRHQFLPACTAKGIQLELHTTPTPPSVTTDMNKRKQLYMIAKEILNNALKHSGCRHITMQSSYTGKYFRLSVSDDGKGFDPGVAVNGNGLTNIRERIAAVKGELEVATTPGQGCTIRLTVPLP